MSHDPLSRRAPAALPLQRNAVVRSTLLVALALGLGACGAADRLGAIGKSPSLSAIQNPNSANGYQPVNLPMPAWLAPVQAVVCCISEPTAEYAAENLRRIIPCKHAIKSRTSKGEGAAAAVGTRPTRRK